MSKQPFVKKKMEKQRSFSVKPIRSLVFFFTISFSVIFLVFFSTWVFKTTPSNLAVISSRNSISFQSVRVFNSSSSDFLLRNSVLFGRHFANSSQAEERESSEERESEAATGNSSLTSFGRNASLDDFNDTKSTVHDSEEELSDALATSDSVNGEEIHDVVNNIKKDDVGTSDERESSVAANSSQAEERESEAAAGNSSLTPFGRNVFLDDFNDTKSTVNDSEEELSDSLALATSDSVNGEEIHDVVNNNIKKDDVRTSSDVSIGNRIEQEIKVACDVTNGRWVFDESYPLYTNVTCPFIDEGFNCGANGRLDKDYMKWRWQPRDCDVPRFNATKMLELLRGKRLVFVGDSLNRNQWESMLCLLMGGVKDPKTVYEARGRRITKERNNYSFKFEEYGCTVEFYVSHFLVHESKARVGKKKAQTLRIDAIDKGSSRWKGADILVFNTAHWWNHHKTKAGINYYQEGDQVHPRLDVTEAFRRALLTWASWVDKNINSRKTRVFFRSSAPSHFSGGLWNTGGHCKEAFRPINETFPSVYPTRNLIAQEILRQMKNPVTFLNITRLSDYRPDAHPSMYGRKSVNPGVQDCSHWCLPGVPDNWNELLYYYLQSRTKASSVE